MVSLLAATAVKKCVSDVDMEDGFFHCVLDHFLIPSSD